MKYCQQEKGGDPCPLFCLGEVSLDVLCPCLGSPVQERHGHIVKNATKGDKNDEGTEAFLLSGKDERNELLNLEKRRLRMISSAC